MNVYVVTLGWDYEGEMVVYVAASLELAFLFTNEITKGGQDSTYIYEIEVGNPIFSTVAEWKKGNRVK